MSIVLPPAFYDASTALQFGQIRALDTLIRMRVENLVVRPDGDVGLRRATHVAAMAMAAYNEAYGVHGRGFFSDELAELVAQRLKTANLQPQESRFRDIFAWFDQVAICREMRSNLDRLLKDPLTECILIGIELHVLFQRRMVKALATKYLRAYDEHDVARFSELRLAEDRLNQALTPAYAA